MMAYVSQHAIDRARERFGIDLTDDKIAAMLLTPEVRAVCALGTGTVTIGEIQICVRHGAVMTIYEKTPRNPLKGRKLLKMRRSRKTAR